MKQGSTWARVRRGSMTTTAPGSLETLRQQNRARVLTELQARGTATRFELIEATGLARATVANLVAELLDEGVVIERPDLEPRSASPAGGRPAMLLSLDPASGAFAGIDFGHDAVRAVLVDRAGGLVAEEHVAVDVDDHADAALKAAESIVQRLIERADTSRLVAAGAALSAPLRAGDHSPANDRIFRGWRHVDVASALSERLGVAVRVGNDANLGALAEITFGAGRQCRDLLYVMLSAGVGLGLVLGGEIYEGHGGTAGELGHVVVGGDRVCRCGNRGCLETLASTRVLLEAVAPVHGEVALDKLFELVAAGDLVARRVVIDAGRAVGRTLAAQCSVLDPGLVVVGGELAEAGDVLLDGIREALDEALPPGVAGRYRVAPAKLGARAEAFGAAALAMAGAPADALVRPSAARLEAGVR